jgi:hypothetical protein
VPSYRLAAGIRTGLFTAAATAGVIVGLGLRHDSALAPFLISGRAVAAATTGFLAPPVPATVLGLLVHVVWMLLWGICFSALATPLRGLGRLAAAAGFAALVGYLATAIIPGALGAAMIAATTRPQIVFLLALFAMALVTGMRLART